MEYIKSAALLAVLLNPLLLVVYLADVMKKTKPRQFLSVLLRAGLIASMVFWAFAILGDALFSHLLHAQFASFQIFGGVVFLLIGIQFVFRGPDALQILRGESAHLSGAIAMPILIGPGTISASVLIGKRHDPVAACGTILATVAVSLSILLVLKLLHDLVRPYREKLIQRYIEIAGRILALVAGTISIEMIMRGILTWSRAF